jgi:hypothetical protein
MVFYDRHQNSRGIRSHGSSNPPAVFCRAFEMVRAVAEGCRATCMNEYVPAIYLAVVEPSLTLFCRSGRYGRRTTSRVLPLPARNLRPDRMRRFYSERGQSLPVMNCSDISTNRCMMTAWTWTFCNNGRSTWCQFRPRNDGVRLL